MAIGSITTEDRLFIQEVYSHNRTLDDACDALRFYNLLTELSCWEIVSLLRETIEPREIKKSEVPQFSTFSDCYLRVPRLIVNSGINTITIDQMGFMLRNGKTDNSECADLKYGENHSKTAAMMGLCSVKKNIVSPTALTLILHNKSEKEISVLVPKLCLLMPFVQQYFIQGATQKVKDNLLGVLAESTQKRRRGNCTTIINTIEKVLSVC